MNSSPTPDDATDVYQRLQLAAWRRAMAELYADVRRIAARHPRQAWTHFRDRRDTLFRQHPQTPLSAEQQAAFDGLAYFAYDPALRVMGAIEPLGRGQARTITLPEGHLRITAIGRVHFSLRALDLALTLYWAEGYGGGLFLPFADATNGAESYGGGRYLYDTIKGADLGAGENDMLLDFNFAYNPSCAYNSCWICPLAPPENRLDVAVQAGELAFVTSVLHATDCATEDEKTRTCA